MSIDTNVNGLAALLLQREVEAFFTREVELLDERRFASGVVHLHYRTTA